MLEPPLTYLCHNVLHVNLPCEHIDHAMPPLGNICFMSTIALTSDVHDWSQLEICAPTLLIFNVWSTNESGRTIKVSMIIGVLTFHAVQGYSDIPLRDQRH